MNNNVKNKNEIGAAWLKSSDRGEYISIAFKAEALQGIDLLNSWVNMTVNTRKSKPGHPDYIITAKPKQQQASAPASRPQQQGGFPRPKNFAPQSSALPGGWDDEDPGA